MATGTSDGVIVHNILEKSHIFANKAPKDTASLVFVNNPVNDFKELASDDSRSQFVVNVKKGDRAPVMNVQTITRLKRQRNYPTVLREGQTPITVTRVQYTDKVCPKKIPKFYVKFHGQAI